MRLSTKLVLLLTFSAGVVMVVASLLTLRQREALLREAARDEVRAHALTLKIALEEDYQTGRSLDAQRLINRLRENTGIYSAVLFDAAGEIIGISNTLAAEEFKNQNRVHQVIASGVPAEIPRNIRGEDYVSLMMPLQVEGRRVGAIEIVQPISFIKKLISKARVDIVMTAATLFVMILLVVTAMMRYNLARPIAELLGGAMAVGRGDLNYRVAVRSGSAELAKLAQEFNRMADSLAEQRRAAAHESEERLALERKLRHSEHLAVVGRLAAGVAHEMGAPLQVIDGRAKQLLSHTNAPIETRQRNLIIIRNQAERITYIVRQLLDLARPYNLRLQTTGLASLIHETAELIEIQAENAGVKVELSLDPSATAEIERGLILQVMLNICRNAIQATPRGGWLRVECFKNAAEEDGRLFAAMRATDTGCGIAPEHLGSIWDPFFTTKEVGQGTGLGLPVSKRIVEEHGGWIEAANREEGGAIFTVYLPQTRQAVEREVEEGAFA